MTDPTQKTTDFAKLNSKTGAGGEVHQHAADGGARLTTAQGVVIADNQNSLRAGARGPTLMEDFALREKLFHFDHERIPERVVHARGYGAHGTFTCTRALGDVTRAAPFASEGKKTEVFLRFSTVAGSKGSPDLARDVRGFAVKLYTDEGNWDIVGNNIPVFFIQDAIKFPDLVHAVKPAPDRGFPQAQSAPDNFWDFISLTPEAMHMVMWQMSDRTIPRSFTTMEGFGVHTFRFVNAQGQSTFVKFHWKPRMGLQSVVWDEAVKSNGADPAACRATHTTGPETVCSAEHSVPPPPDSFKGRILGVLISEGFDGGILMALKSAAEGEGGVVRTIAPKTGGAMCNNGHLHPVTDQLGGAPSVLFDAVAILPGTRSLAQTPAALEFVKDTYVHCKYIGLTKPAMDVVAASGLDGAQDGGMHALTDDGSAQAFVTACRGLRFWKREDLMAK